MQQGLLLVGLRCRGKRHPKSTVWKCFGGRDAGSSPSFAIAGAEEQRATYSHREGSVSALPPLSLFFPLWGWEGETFAGVTWGEISAGGPRGYQKNHLGVRHRQPPGRPVMARRETSPYTGAFARLHSPLKGDWDCFAQKRDDFSFLRASQLLWAIPVEPGRLLHPPSSTSLCWKKKKKTPSKSCQGGRAHRAENSWSWTALVPTQNHTGCWMPFAPTSEACPMPWGDSNSVEQNIGRCCINSLLQWKDQAFQKAPVQPRHGLSWCVSVKARWSTGSPALPTDPPLFFPRSAFSLSLKTVFSYALLPTSSRPAILASLVYLLPHLKGLVR